MKDETMKKPEIIHDHNNFMQGVDRAEQNFAILPMLRENREMD